MPDNTPPPSADGTCTYILADDGDYCDILAERCGIKPKQFYEFNGDGTDKFCNTIKPRQPYCCGKGEKPDLRPKKNADGTCVEYSINNMLCGDIQDMFYLKDGDLDDFNKGKTWGWAGCKRLMPGKHLFDFPMLLFYVLWLIPRMNRPEDLP